MNMGYRDVGDVTADIVAVGAVVGWLPDIAALLALIWTSIRIYEWVRVRILKKPQDIKL